MSALGLLGLLACSIPIRHARLEAAAEPSAVEIEAARRVEQTPCRRGVEFIWPGVGPACHGYQVEGVVMAGLGATEVGLGLALLDLSATTNGQNIPWVAFQDLYIISALFPAMDRRLARQHLYVPQDSLSEVIAAPFNSQVLAKPGVWGGVVALVAGGAIVGGVLGDGVPAGDPLSAPNLWGVRVPPLVGYPTAFAADAVTMGHVAIAEEMLFRGTVQSELSRVWSSEWAGWGATSAGFGAAHFINLLSLPAQDRATYATVAVPYITLAGAYMGWVYRANAYSLAPPVALHFWYNVLLVMGDVAINPNQNFFSMRWSAPF